MRHQFSWLSCVAVAGLLLGSSPAPLSATAEQSSFYDQMAPSFLATFPVAQQGDHRDEEEIQKKNPFEIPVLNERERSQISLNILKEDAKLLADSTKTSTVITPEVWKNLEIFANPHQKPDKTVLGAINHTHTTMGRISLAKLLSNPITDITQLKKRQNLIRRLISDDELFDKLDQALRRLSKEESSLLSLTKESDPLLQKNIEMMWYTGNPFSKSAGGMGFFKGMTDFGLIFNPIFFGALGLWWSSFLAFDKEGREKAVEGLNNAFGGNKNTLSKALVYSSPALLFGFIYLTFKMTVPRIKSFKYIRTRLRSGHILIHTLRKLEELMDDDAFAPLRDRLDTSLEQADDHYDELYELLSKKTFRKKWYLFTGGGGDVLAALPALKENVQNLFRGVHLVAEMDAYLSIAKLFRAQKDAGMPYSFATYVRQDKPYIAAHDFWHPSLPAAKAVTNSLVLGEVDKHRNLVITGVNAGGKSTVMKAMACCILFAQTVGIVPAHQFVFTPFSRINTYLNITDDLAADRSLFKAELYRARTLLYDVANLRPGEFCFTVLDEILTGTERVEGEAAAYGIARSIGQAPQAITLLATHFPGLTHLEKETNGQYKNMKVVVHINEDGSFNYPYKLVDGATNQQIALDILEQEGFAPAITQKARDVMSNPIKYTPTDADV